MIRITYVCIVALTALCTASAKAQTDDDTVVPQLLVTVHNQGNLQLPIWNNGFIGWDVLRDATDPFTGDTIRFMQYPRDSEIGYGMLGLWVGALTSKGALVSTALHNRSEFNPDRAPYGEFEFSSIDVNRNVYSPDAHSNLDITCVYYDTLPLPVFTFPGWSPHTPMGLRVTQRSMAWSGPFIDDFVLIQFEVANIGNEHLREVYMGLIWEIAGAARAGDSTGGIAGFLRDYYFPDGCGFDTVNVAFAMFADGGPQGRQWTPTSPLAALGTRILQMPADTLTLNFNWWVAKWIDDTTVNPTGIWGPRRAPTPESPLLDYGTDHGGPLGDVNKYDLMSRPEFDYNQLLMAIDHSADGWLPPPSYKDFYVYGGWTEYVQSFGPIDLPPRAAVEFTVAIVGGDSVHTNAEDFEDLWNPQFPESFINTLDFTRLAENARWADWVYDNPGVDSDGDGYFGEFRFCDGDTFWYKGDGVPDFRADVPPPSPIMRVIPSVGKLVIRWNGYEAENFIDPFTRVKDFEGYRLYVGLDDRTTSLSIISSYDRQNFNRYVSVQRPNGRFEWENNDLPFSLDSLRALYNNPSFEPLLFTRTNPLVVNDSLYRFETQDFNRYDLSDPNGIHKVYPDAIDPGPDSTLWQDNDVVFDYDRPLPRFYEYEYVYYNLLPTVPYYVSVTAFDFGLAEGNIPARESEKLENLTRVFAQIDIDSVESLNLDVYIYPNPYRIDAAYAQRGFENREHDLAPERARLVHFVNMPKVATISIYSLDGDMIDIWEHNFPQGGPEAMHDEWDLITRNGLEPVSGIYYWVVESATRTQIGKLVIIK